MPYVRVTDCVNTQHVLITDRPPRRECPIDYINEDWYRVRSTGDVRRFERKAERKADDPKAVRKSFNRLKQLINCNYDSPSSVRFVTLTYAENMTDNSKITGHWAYFVRNMRALYGRFRYIYVKEKQARGAWHIHAILFFSGEAPYMENKDVAACWGRGFVNVQGFSDDINNLGNYLCAYLTDDKETSKKGARLANYESGVRLWSCSRDVRRPVEYEGIYDDYIRDFAEREPLSHNETWLKLPGVAPRRYVYEIYAAE